MTIAVDPSCMDDFEADAIPTRDARRRMLEAAAPLAGFERLPLRTALGRVAAAAITSPLTVPGHTNSAMDGFAVAGASLPASGDAELRVVGSAFAGHAYEGELETGQCVRIMTGAVVPAQADTVIAQEHTEALGEDRIRVDDRHRAGQNVRRAGEDIQAGDTVVPAGRRLTAADLGLLASLGVGEVGVTRRPRVAFFSTGDELRSLGERLAPGEIYDSNRYTLYGMLTELGVELIDMGVVVDTPETTRDAFRRAADSADAVITSGGVSVGEADYIKQSVAELGRIEFSKVAMKPGRPMTFGRVGDALFFGLPGNPVSVMVTFYLFVQPALRRLAGEDAADPLILRARSEARLRKKPGRTEYQRGVLTTDDNGGLVVDRTGPQGSGILTSMSQANCLIVLPAGYDTVEPGATVPVIPFSELRP